MNGKLSTTAALASVGGACVVAAAILVAVAQAAGGGSVTKPHPPRDLAARQAVTVYAGGSGVPALAGQLGRVTCGPTPFARRGAAKSKAKPAAAAPPSDALKDAFGILRRDRNDDDALPAKALALLKSSGLAPVDPQSARLLRADGAARAWVVPVPDVGPSACTPGPAAKPREGLAVVSVGGAPAGGGGTLTELQRGTAVAAMDSCAGTGRNMLGVSGIVPDGVDGVFITAADGSATRADVHDNGYTFVLPRPQRPETRYVVWTGTDGKPHVQPLAAMVFGKRAVACPAAANQIRLTPSPGGAICGLNDVLTPITARNRALVAARQRARVLARVRARSRSKGRIPPVVVDALPVPGASWCTMGAATPTLYAPSPLVTVPALPARSLLRRPRRAAPARPAAPTVRVTPAPPRAATAPGAAPAPTVVTPAPRAVPAPSATTPRRAPAPAVTTTPALPREP